MAINIVLVEPRIPQNTGNIARTCVVTGSVLHIVKPMGFALDEKHIKRAGLDYWKDLQLCLYESIDEFFEQHKQADFWFFSSKVKQNFDEAKLRDGCFLIFGNEVKGLDKELLAQHEEHCIRIPMVEGQRCLNLSNAVCVGVYEALRQNSYFRMR